MKRLFGWSLLLGLMGTLLLRKQTPLKLPVLPETRPDKRNVRIDITEQVQQFSKNPSDRGTDLRKVN